MLAVAVIVAFAYWPGLMTWDAVRQYGQVLDRNFDDWHPPAMEWLWLALVPIHSGPQPMLVLQLLLYWSGFALLAGWALAAHRRGVAAAIVEAINILSIFMSSTVVRGGLIVAYACRQHEQPNHPRTAIAEIARFTA